MKKIYSIISMIVFMTVVMSCDLEKDLDSPNDVGISEADPNLLMNKAQADFGLFYAKIAGNHNILTRGVSQLVRQKAMQGSKFYNRAYTPQNLDEIWKDSYQKVLVNLETLIPLAEEKELNVHLGVAHILKALTYITLVDNFGDVPLTEALKGTEGNFNPVADAGATVYAEAIAMLEKGRVALAANLTGTGLARDIFYNGNRDRWTTLANSIELKAQLNLTADPASKAAATARISALFAANNLIDTDAEEFTYKWGTAAVPVISKNPTYQEYYGPVAGNAGGNIGNWFMKEMYRGTGVQDPRWRYYFYRQVGSKAQALIVDANSLGCGNVSPPAHYVAEGQPFCLTEPGFIGRDHGDDSGQNPDGAVITAVGAYPYGGRVDTNDGNASYAVATVNGQGGNGRGIEPIYMSWFTDFMKAEAVLTGLITGDAKALMLAGVAKSIDRTRSFSVALGQTLPAGLEPSPVTYLATLGGLYDVATPANQKDIVYKEYWKSLWGNGPEAYNLYRRTGSPLKMQPSLAPAPGEFVYSLIYPANYVNLNSSATVKSETQRVFWDKTGLVLR